MSVTSIVRIAASATFAIRPRNVSGRIAAALLALTIAPCAFALDPGEDGVRITIPVSGISDAAQAAIFDAFFRWRAKDGAQWFSFPIVQAAGEAMALVRFLGEADWTPRGGAGRWAVTAAIEIRERSVLPAPMLDFSVPENSQYIPLI